MGGTSVLMMSAPNLNLYSVKKDEWSWIAWAPAPYRSPSHLTTVRVIPSAAFCLSFCFDKNTRSGI